MGEAHAYSFGIEEEYFIFNLSTGQVVSQGTERFMEQAMRRLGDSAMPEMLQSQIEVATPPCGSAEEIRKHLVHFRATLADEGARHGLGIAAMGTFPLAYWRAQIPTRKERYDAIIDDLQMLGFRNMLCGMHVHVEVPTGRQRMGLIQRVVPYLPLFLALSTSSPFWEEHDTGLRGYRLAAYDELPRTGLPELLRTDAEYDEYVGALVDAGIIEDGSHIWWAIRPSAKHPTIELRVADSCTRLEDAIAIGALFRSMVAAFDRNPDLGAPLNRIGRAITNENKWRAQRYGAQATFVEPHTRKAVSVAGMLEGLEEQLGDTSEDALAAHIHLRRIIQDGTSADEQLRTFETARTQGLSSDDALRAVVDWAARTTAGEAASVQVRKASPRRMPHL